MRDTKNWLILPIKNVINLENIDHKLQIKESKLHSHLK